MLRVTLSKYDYVMIGDDIRLEYSGNTGKGSSSIAISAPKDVKILRKSIYEAAVQKMAEQGDTEAQTLTARLEEDRQETQRVSALRRAKQQYHKARAKERKAL